MLRTADLNYDLPAELIATTPADPRDSARLLVVSRSDPSRLEHRVVLDLPAILRPPSLLPGHPRDLMVVNATRVLPARFRGVRPDTGGHAEGLYVGPATLPVSPASAPDQANAPGPFWSVLLKMRRLKPGVTVVLLDHQGQRSNVRLRLIERAGGHAPDNPDTGGWIVAVESTAEPLDSTTTASDLLNRIGLTPVPPYILSARKKSQLEIADERDRSTYQTVYASAAGERPGFGSVAAPTAGLHFTPALLDRLQTAGVDRAEVTLDVGLGTYKPVETEFVEQHPMHSEWCGVPRETALAIQRMRARSVGDEPRDARTSHHLPAPRLIAVGTTAARTLESFASVQDMLTTGTHDTRLLITPAYRFKHVDALLTNFHLPGTTLLAMVAAMLARPDEAQSVAIDRLKRIYSEAVRERYRFFSFGDAMLILP